MATRWICEMRPIFLPPFSLTLLIFHTMFLSLTVPISLLFLPFFLIFFFNFLFIPYGFSSTSPKRQNSITSSKFASFFSRRLESRSSEKRVLKSQRNFLGDTTFYIFPSKFQFFSIESWTSSFSLTIFICSL